MVSILPMGDRALLVEVADLAEVLAVREALAETRLDCVTEIVPAARTVLVRVDPARGSLASVTAWVRATADDPAPRSDARASALIEVPTEYTGEDLHAVAAERGWSVEELVRRHTEAQWTVAFTGFAPGFGYLASPTWAGGVSRLPSPRTRVPAGAVGLAGEFTGIYPRPTPGGWRLIGRTDLHLFDARSPRPALLTPGDQVRFRAVASVPQPTPSPAPTQVAAPSVTVIEPGLLATLQDLGRPGLAASGIARSGALDRGALRTVNRLLGNDESATAVEITMGGFRAAATRDLVIAIGGAWGAVRIAGRAVDPYQPHVWGAGERLDIDWFDHGARAYLAVRGGFDGDLVSGSRATDVLAGLGPAPLVAGSALGVCDDAPGEVPHLDAPLWGPPPDDEILLDIAPGPRADWISPESGERLFDAAWIVSNDSDRVGVRLDGPALERVGADELPSEPMVPGAIQVPPSGDPTILLADGPVTGGYPVVGVATEASLDRIAQARPGTRVRFRHARVSV